MSDIDTLRVGAFFLTCYLVGSRFALEGYPLDRFVFEVFVGSSEVV